MREDKNSDRIESAGGFFLERFDAAYSFRISPDNLFPLLFCLDISFALETAVAGPAGGRAADIDLKYIPAVLCQRGINRRIVS